MNCFGPEVTPDSLIDDIELMIAHAARSNFFIESMSLKSKDYSLLFLNQSPPRYPYMKLVFRGPLGDTLITERKEYENK